MAPPKGSRKPPAVRPAMPLPHVKRAAAAAAAKNKTVSQPGSEVKGVTSPLQRSPSTDKSSVNEVTSPTAATRNASVKSSVATVNGQRPLAGGATLSPLDHEKDPSAVSPKPTAAGPDKDVNGHRSQDATDRTPKPTQPAAPVEAESRQEAPKEHSAKPSVSIPAGQPLRQMPPAFQPASRPDARPPVVNGHPHMHRPHPSSGSVHFGAFHDSAGTSPAPPHSGGIAPPPTMPTPDGRQAWMPPTSNGFPPGMPPNMDMMAANNYDGYGRPDLAYSHLDPYGHYGNFPPSTPQSFHDSSGSAHPDEFHTMPPSAPPQGPAGFAEESRQQAPAEPRDGVPYWPMGPWFPWVPSDPPDPPPLHEFSRQFFGSGFLADCTLELRHRDTRLAPYRMPAHRLYLLRSSALNDQVREQARLVEEARQQGRQPPPGSDIVVVQADDDWVNPHSFSLAMQTLYGQRLLEPPRRRGTDGNMAGSDGERFNFALSYAASGRLLGMRSVVRRGCEMAAELLNSETIEVGFEFAVDQYEDKGTHENLKWGDGSRVLLDSVLGYIFAHLTENFAFDASALGSPYTRLPYDVPSPAQPKKEPTSPVIVRGNAPGHKSSLSQSQHIQFGDLSLNPHSGSRSQPLSAAFQATLSRILVNLPFGYLKPVLEARFPGNHHMSGEARLRIIQEVVQEREARRERAIQAVEAGQVPDAAQIRASLCYVEPTFTGPWSMLGWKEEVAFPAGADGPVLSRQWVPLRAESKASAPAYP